MIRTYLFIAAVFVLLTNNINAQSDPKTDLLNLFRKYKEASSLDLKFEMKLVLSQNKHNKSYSGVVKASDNLYYSSIMGKTTINNDDVRIIIDDNMHLVMCTDGINDRAYKDLVSGLVISEDILNGMKISYKSNSDNATVIELKEPYSGNTMLYTINAKSGLLSKYECTYSANAADGISRMEITYTKMEVNSKLDKSFFSTHDVVKRSGKRLSLLGKYASYQLIDQIKK
jgi:outer membrane lipoprotein-sorting protein